MNFVPESNPKIRALARIAARKIKALRTENEAQIAEIYRDFQNQVNAIKAEEANDSRGVELFEQADQIFNQPHYQEASADELEPPNADPSPTTEVNQS
jgi:hypothetical protein